MLEVVENRKQYQEESRKQYREELGVEDQQTDSCGQVECTVVVHPKLVDLGIAEVVHHRGSAQRVVVALRMVACSRASCRQGSILLDQEKVEHSRDSQVRVCAEVILAEVSTNVTRR